MAVTGVSMAVNAEIADMRTSSLTSTFPCTKVCVRGDGGTVMYVDTWVKKTQTPGVDEIHTLGLDSFDFVV